MWRVNWINGLCTSPKYLEITTTNSWLHYMKCVYVHICKSKDWINSEQFWKCSDCFIKSIAKRCFFVSSCWYEGCICCRKKWITCVIYIFSCTTLAPFWTHKIYIFYIYHIGITLSVLLSVCSSEGPSVCADSCPAN